MRVEARAEGPNGLFQGPPGRPSFRPSVRASALSTSDEWRLTEPVKRRWGVPTDGIPSPRTPESERTLALLNEGLSREYERICFVSCPGLFSVRGFTESDSQCSDETASNNTRTRGCPPKLLMGREECCSARASTKCQVFSSRADVLPHGLAGPRLGRWGESNDAYLPST